MPVKPKMENPNLRRINFGVLIISLNTLMIELLLMRVFDVILWSNFAYMIITCAMFSFGLAGVYSALRPISAESDVCDYLSRIAFLFSLTTLFTLPALNIIPFSLDEIGERPLIQVLSFLGMYLVIMFPFFFSGLMFTTLFSYFPRNIQRLYCWDLAGGAIGCIFLLPFLPIIGAGGLVFLSAGLIMIASALFSERRSWIRGTLCVALFLLVFPFLKDSHTIDFRLHDNKRRVISDISEGRLEYTKWDPISRIDVINDPENNKKHIAYDGGSQSSYIYAFDGNLDYLRENLLDMFDKQFWFRGVLASHYLKRDTGYKTLVIGSAGGQEIKAALLFGASRIDAVEMVGTVVDLGKNRYAEYGGGIYNDPRVRASVGEGRTFLRHSQDKYDVIQIFSNHTSSSIAAGTGAMETVYLQTVEAYREYFSHLTDDGILHVNHHVYPRMIATAATAWKELGRSDFKQHVVVFERPDRMDNLPTMLIKMKIWKEKEIDDLVKYFSRSGKIPLQPYQMVENPLDAKNSFLKPAVYQGELSDSRLSKVGYHMRIPRDNQPFFNFLRKKLERLSPDRENFLNYSTAELLNSSLKRGIIPMDVVHLPLTGLAALFYAAIFILVPLRFSEAGRKRWDGKYRALLYFSCLGAGFIIFELVSIQIFMKLVGFPLYTYSTVIFTVLLSAGIGSLSSRYFISNGKHGHLIPFLGIILSSMFIIFGCSPVIATFLASSTPVRILVTIALIFPLGFFLGMPFPMGILQLESKPRGSIAWAWGMNGLFTVIGGFSSVLLSLYFGFRMTLMVAALLYLAAFMLFPKNYSDSLTMQG